MASAADSVTNYLDLVFQMPTIAPGLRAYRGEADIGWELKPSVMRNLRPGAESRMFSELVLESPNEFAAERSMFGKLVIARHYGLPTRLLDVSLNPLVGLYFACNDGSSQDGVVRIFDFKEQRIKFADSDAVSLICNLTRLSDNERRCLIKRFKQTSTWNDKARRAFRGEAAMLRLSQFVRMEKPYFLHKVEPRDLFKYFFVYPEKNNPRLIAQSGAFIAAGLLEYRKMEKSNGLTISKIVIPASHKARIVSQLDTLNINSRTMFPEIAFAAKYIEAKFRKLRPKVNAKSGR